MSLITHGGVLYNAPRIVVASGFTCVEIGHRRAVKAGGEPQWMPAIAVHSLTELGVHLPGIKTVVFSLS